MSRFLQKSSFTQRLPPARLPREPNAMSLIQSVQYVGIWLKPLLPHWIVVPAARHDPTQPPGYLQEK